MQEDEEDADRTDILHQEQVKMEILSAQGAPVGKLVTHNLMRNEPSNEDAGEESDDRQENLACYEVKPVEHGPLEERQALDST